MWGRNELPSNVVNIVIDWDRVREPMDFQQVRDIMHVATPSSITMCLMVILCTPHGFERPRGKVSEA
jgi:hypothetical protein